MINRTPEDRMRYDARLKFQRDEESRLRSARQEGREEGFGRGKIAILQQLLGISESTTEELASLTPSQLADLEEKLKQQLRARRSS